MSKPPFTLVIAAAVLALEGLCVLGLGGYVAVMTVIGRPHDLASSIAEAAIGVVFGAALIWVAWGAFGAQRWSRSPGVLAQIFALPVAITLIQSGRQVAGAALLVAALTAIVTLLAPPSTRVLYDGVFPDGPAEDGGTAPPDSGTAKPGEGPKGPKGKRSGTGRGRDSRPR